MIQDGTKLKVADNTGALLVECIKPLGGSRRRYAQIGDIIVASVKKAQPHKEIEAGDVIKAVVTRQRKPFKRKTGGYIKFDENAVVVLDDGEVQGGRIFGPVPRDLKQKGFEEIVSLAKEIV